MRTVTWGLYQTKLTEQGKPSKNKTPRLGGKSTLLHVLELSFETPPPSGQEDRWCWPKRQLTLPQSDRDKVIMEQSRYLTCFSTNRRVFEAFWTFDYLLNMCLISLWIYWHQWSRMSMNKHFLYSVLTESWHESFRWKRREGVVPPLHSANSPLGATKSSHLDLEVRGVSSRSCSDRLMDDVSPLCFLPTVAAVSQVDLSPAQSYNTSGEFNITKCPVHFYGRQYTMLDVSTAKLEARLSSVVF